MYVWLNHPTSKYRPIKELQSLFHLAPAVTRYLFLNFVFWKLAVFTDNHDLTRWWCHPFMILNQSMPSSLICPKHLISTARCLTCCFQITNWISIDCGQCATLWTLQERRTAKPGMIHSFSPSSLHYAPRYYFSTFWMILLRNLIRTCFSITSQGKSPVTVSSVRIK